MTTVRYLVNDVDAAIAFYTQQLGFTLSDRMGPAFAIVASGDLKLWLSGPQSSAAKALPDGRQPAAGGWNRIVVETDNLAALAAALKQAGVVFRSEIIDGVGGKQVLIEDPAGNPIELFESARRRRA